MLLQGAWMQPLCWTPKRRIFFPDFHQTGYICASLFQGNQSTVPKPFGFDECNACLLGLVFVERPASQSVVWL